MKRERILVIDDNDGTRFLIKEALEPEGYEVVEACDGYEGIKLYREQPVDLVISDILMPKENGLAVIHKLRNNFPDLRIIAITCGLAEEHKDFLLMAKILGASHVIHKPLDIRKLLKTVRQALDKRRIMHDPGERNPGSESYIG